MVLFKNISDDLHTVGFRLTGLIETKTGRINRDFIYKISSLYNRKCSVLANPRPWFTKNLDVRDRG